MAEGLLPLGCIVHTPAGISFTCRCMTTDPGVLKPGAAFSVLESVSSVILDTTSLLSCCPVNRCGGACKLETVSHKQEDERVDFLCPAPFRGNA